MVFLRQLLSPAYERIGKKYCKRRVLRAFEKQRFSCLNERSVEYSFAFRAISMFCPQTVLDVGTGKTAFPSLVRTCGPVVTAVDNIDDYWPTGMLNSHFHVIQDNIVQPAIQGPFDMITCISVLEHIPQHQRAVQSMFGLLRPGGQLVLTVPYSEHTYIEDIYRHPEAGYGRTLPYVAQVFSRHELEGWLRDNGGSLVCEQYWQVFSGKYWTFGKRLVPPVETDANSMHQLGCFVLQKSGQ